MEITGRTRLHLINYHDGLDSFNFGTTSNSELDILEIQNTNLSSDVRTNNHNEKSENSRKTSKSRNELYLKNVPESKKQWKIMSNYLRPMPQCTYKKHEILPDLTLRNFEFSVKQKKSTLSRVYFYITITETHRCFLRLIYVEEPLQMTSPPFGLSSAAHIFVTVMNWIAEILRSRGKRDVVHLDDLPLASKNRATLITQLKETIGLLRFAN